MKPNPNDMTLEEIAAELAQDTTGVSRPLNVTLAEHQKRKAALLQAQMYKRLMGCF